MLRDSVGRMTCLRVRSLVSVLRRSTVLVMCRSPDLLFFLLFFSTCKYSKLSYEMSHWHIVVRRYQKPPNHAYQARYHAIPHPTYGLQLEQELGAN
jgi:hypothetical protein